MEVADLTCSCVRVCVCVCVCSTMFGSVLSYVSLRLLGEAASEPHMLAAQRFIRSHGGALYAPSW